MTCAQLLKIAERIEKATGADRALDAEIGAAIRWHPPGCESWVAEFPTFTVKANKIAAGELRWAAPAFTSSLDAAASLVPEGMCWSVTRKESGLHVACVWRGPAHCCRATQTAALALTAAALRAMAEEAGDE